MNKFYVHILLIFALVELSLQYDMNEDYESNYDQQQQLYLNLQAAQKSINKKLDSTQYDAGQQQRQQQKSPPKIMQDYSLVENWPTPAKRLGAVSAVALDVYKNVVVFHRVDRVWNSVTFDVKNVYTQQHLGPITDNTIITFDRETGNVIKEWGKNLFYLPHGLHINGNYYYVTDVALQQVFRFNIQESLEKPDLVLGDAFKPGRSATTFCKPTSVVSLEDGEFFVADGYCNTRIIKYSFDGKKLLEWGTNTFSGGQSLSNIKPPNEFAIPHALTLVPDKKLLCVADRENGRVQCFFTSDGKFHSQYHSEIVGNRLFSVDYANNTLFVVNGPEYDTNEVAGYGFDMSTGDVSVKFGAFLDPHDLAVTPDAREIYVGDLSLNNKTRTILYKYRLNGVKPTMTREGEVVPSVKTSMHRGETALIVGSIVLLFSIFTAGIAILISKRKMRGRRKNIHLKFPWERTSSAKNLFYEYNKFEKVPTSDGNEFA